MEQMQNDKKYEIVSLGINCLPRTVLTRLGLKPRKAQGELSCPFDLVMHKLDRITYYLSNNFEDYFDDLYFKLGKKHIFDFRQKGTWRKTDGTQFRHDKDCKAGDKEKLIARVKSRIENFNNIMKNERPVLFVLNVYTDYGDVLALYNELKRLRQDRFFKLAVFDFEGHLDFDAKYNDDIYVLRIPKPIENYKDDWNASVFLKTKLAKYFENCIGEFIKDIIKKDFS
jgi:hypothetical protein